MKIRPTVPIVSVGAAPPTAVARCRDRHSQMSAVRAGYEHNEKQGRTKCEQATERCPSGAVALEYVRRDGGRGGAHATSATAHYETSDHARPRQTL